jgi:hypothetical protein
MQVYQNQKKITTWLYFYLKGAGSEFLDYKLPFPNVLQHINRGYFVGWQINGFPGTKEAREYFNDIIARFLITFKDYYPEKLDFKPKLDKYTHIDFKNSYELKQFQNLDSIETHKHIQKRAENVNTIDQTFWAIKYYTEELIREMGFVPYQMLEEFAYRHFYHKEKSTLRAKCKAIWNWYNERDWTISQTRARKTQSEEELFMTRNERAKKNAELKYKRARATILGFIQENLFSDEYKRGGKWNLTKLSKEIGIHRDTIRKHLKEMQEEGLI